MPSRSARTTCPVAHALDRFGDRWSLLILRDMFAGKTLFREFMASPEGIASNILTARLRALEDADIVEKFIPEGGNPARPHYRPSDTGRELFPVLDAIATWGLAHIPDTRKQML